MGNVGKPPHQPAGKARTSEEWRSVQDQTKIDEMRQMTMPDPSKVPTGDEGAPILHGGQRPGVRSRIDETVEGNEDLQQAKANFLRNSIPHPEE